jgi:hypothetical protein
LDVGAISAGTTIPAGTTLTEFIESLLLATFFPTYVVPTLVVTTDQPLNQESGVITDVLVTATFNQGQIVGDSVGGVWSPVAVQGPRAGAATGYTIVGEDTGALNSRTVGDYQVVDGSQTFAAVVDFAEGPQPLDSTGAPYETPLAAGSMGGTRAVNGRRRAFYGSSEDPTIPSESDDVRALAGSVLNPANGTSFTISIAAGAEIVAFAYPATLRDVSSVILGGTSFDIKDSYTQSVFTVAGANGYAPVNYKVYYFVPVEPFTDPADHVVTI